MCDFKSDQDNQLPTPVLTFEHKLVCEWKHKTLFRNGWWSNHHPRTERSFLCITLLDIKFSCSTFGLIKSIVGLGTDLENAKDRKSLWLERGQTREVRRRRRMNFMHLRWSVIKKGDNMQVDDQDGGQKVNKYGADNQLHGIGANQ